MSGDDTNRKTAAAESRERARVMEMWGPGEHLTRATLLAAMIDKQWDDGGRWVGDGGFLSTPPCLTLAQVHLQIAATKHALRDAL